MITTLTERGQTVIPSVIRKAHHLQAQSKLEWIDDGNCIKVIPLPEDTIKSCRGIFGKGRLREKLLNERAKDKTHAE